MERASELDATEHHNLCTFSAAIVIQQCTRYPWSDALTADAAEKFSEAGSFYDEAVARSLHDHIMSIGDTIDPAEGFREFRGRDVDTGALLRKRGFPIQ